MRAQASGRKDRASSLTPSVVSGMPWRVTEVAVLPDFRLKVRFLDGTEGVAEMAALVRAADAGIFAALADPERFAEAYVDLGAVAWPGGQDLAPDTMYRGIKEHGIHTPL